MSKLPQASMELSNYIEALIFKKQSIEETEFMKIAQTFQRPKMLYWPPKFTHCHRYSTHTTQKPTSNNQFLTGHVLLLLLL